MSSEAHEAKRQSCTEIMVELVHNEWMMRWPKSGAGQDLADLIQIDKAEARYFR